MSDIEKTKIDILRDALKDASDTVRALDRKINFLVSYNAVFLGLISTLYIKFEYIKVIIVYYECFYGILALISLIWVHQFIQMMMSISPKSNPIEVFKQNEDREFSNNTFFIFTDGNEKSLELDKLTTNYNSLTNFEDIQKLLYKEIGKVSYIRDLKLNSVKRSVTASKNLTFSFLTFIIIFSLWAIIKESSHTETSICSEKNDSQVKVRKREDGNIHIINNAIIEIKSLDINVSKEDDTDKDKDISTLDINNSTSNVNTEDNNESN